MKVFNDGIGFSGWHYFSKRHGTAIRYMKLRPGLFGLQTNRNDNAVSIGFWWAVELSLVAVHPSQFKPSSQQFPANSGDNKNK